MANEKMTGREIMSSIIFIFGLIYTIVGFFSLFDLGGKTSSIILTVVILLCGGLLMFTNIQDKRKIPLVIQIILIILPLLLFVIFYGGINIEVSSPKDCLADEECFRKALTNCDKVNYAYCLLGMCEKASIIKQEDGKCLVRNWLEDNNGKIKNYDKTCLITQLDLIGERPGTVC